MSEINLKKSVTKFCQKLYKKHTLNFLKLGSYIRKFHHKAILESYIGNLRQTAVSECFVKNVCQESMSESCVEGCYRKLYQKKFRKAISERYVR